MLSSREHRRACRCRFVAIEEPPRIDALEKEFRIGIEQGVIDERFLRNFANRELRGIAFDKTRFKRRFKPPRGRRRWSIGFRSNRGRWFELALPLYEGKRKVESAALYCTEEAEQDEVERALWSIAQFLQAEVGGRSAA